VTATAAAVSRAPRSHRLRGVVAGGLGLLAVIVAAGIFTQFGTIAPGLVPAVALLVCALPVFVIGGVLLIRAGVFEAPEGGYPLTLLAPAVAYYAAFFLIPLGFLVLFSVAHAQGFGDVQYGFSLENFSRALDSLYIDIFVRTLRFAAVGTILTILVGWPLAYWLARYASPKRKNLLLALVIIPFWTSFLIRTYALKIILDPHGYLAKDFGIDILYTKYAVGIGLVYNYLPLFILPVFASLERMDWTLIEAATDLGAKPVTAFKDITLRLTLPGVVTGGLLVFIPMCGEFIIPDLLGGPDTLMIGHVLWDEFFTNRDWPLASAVAVAMLVLLVLPMGLLRRYLTGERA
jgi:spermidine/putrescine transport system permease protein